VPARRLGIGFLALAACALLVACSPARPGSVGRRTLDGGLCEELFAFARPPRGAFDRVGVRRLAPCGAARDAGAPVVLYLPGMHMNGALPARGPDLRRHLARSGIRVWSVDYRTHVVPADASRERLGTLAAWTHRVFADDAAWLADMARLVDPGPFVVMGFSFGGGLAYELAALDYPMAGLVVLDAVPPAPRDDARAGDPAIDVASSRLPFDVRARLLAAVIDDPAGSSPLPGFATAGDALAEIVHSARAFGGHGGLSNVKARTTDVRDLAALLATYDRWWPRAAAGTDPRTPMHPNPLVAFAAARMGPEWVARVRAGARAFGGDGATVHELAGFGHLDVLIGREAPQLVFEPVRRFVLARSEAPGGRPGPSSR
jgi:thioesterase domain-containing protein